MNTKLFTVYVLSQLAPVMNLIQQTGAGWKIVGQIPGYTETERAYPSRDLAVAAIVDYFYTLFQQNPNLAKDIESAVPALKRAG
jgi:hypothetical protein